MENYVLYARLYAINPSAKSPEQQQQHGIMCICYLEYVYKMGQENPSCNQGYQQCYPDFIKPSHYFPAVSIPFCLVNSFEFVTKNKPNEKESNVIERQTVNQGVVD